MEFAIVLGMFLLMFFGILELGRLFVDGEKAGGSQGDLEQLRRIGELMQATSHCGLGQTAPNPVLDSLLAFPEIYLARLGSEGFGPAFDLDQALAEARELRAEEPAP